MTRPLQIIFRNMAVTLTLTLSLSLSRTWGAHTRGMARDLLRCNVGCRVL